MAAKRKGVVGGVDYQLTGMVRFVQVRRCPAVSLLGLFAARCVVPTALFARCLTPWRSSPPAGMYVCPACHPKQAYPGMPRSLLPWAELVSSSSAVL